DADEALTDDALEDVVRHGRSDEGAVADHEQILGAALGDVTIVREHDRLVEPGLLRLRLGERRIHVRTGDLAAGRDRVVVDPTPALDATADAAVDVDVGPEGDSEDGERRLQIVEADTDELAALVHERSDVGVLAVAAPAEELD